MGRGHGLGGAVDGGYRDVYSTWWVIVSASSRARDRKVVLVLTENIGAENRQVDVFHGDFAHLRQVDGHLSGLQMEEAGLIDN